MVFIAAATCKDQQELNDLRAKLQATMLRPEVVGLNVHIEYEPSPGTSRFEIDTMVTLLTQAFESIGTHGITMIP